MDSGWCKMIAFVQFGPAVGFYKSGAGRAEGSNYVDVRSVPEFTLGLPAEAEETFGHSYEALVAMTLREP
jgi:hypothetical protein